MTGHEPGSGGGSPKPHKWIALDLKPEVLRYLGANEKLRQIAKALGISLEVFRTVYEARGGGKADGLPGFLVCFSLPTVVVRFLFILNTDTSY